MHNFDDFINEDNEGGDFQAVIDAVLEKLKGSFSYNADPVIFTTPAHKYFTFSLIIGDGITPAELETKIKKLIPEVQKIFNRLYDSGLDPLICANEKGKGRDGLRLSFGNIDLKNSEIFKSVSSINKYNL